MDGPRDFYTSEVSHRKTDIIWYHIYGILKKNDTNDLLYKIEIDSQISKIHLWLPKGKERGRIN